MRLFVVNGFGCFEVARCLVIALPVYFVTDY